MGTITIVGLGPGDVDLMTRAAWARLEGAHEVWLRTRVHPTVAQLPAHLILHSCDDLYERADDFAQVYEEIVQRVLALGARPEGVVYAVPGHPLVGEATVTLILARAAGCGCAVEIVDGMSFVEPVLSALGLDALAGLQIYDALELAARHHPPFNPDLPALVGQLYSRALAADVKLVLMAQYPDEHEVVLIHAVGSPAQRVERLPLFELDRRDEVAHLTALFIPPLPPVSGFEDFQETVAHLRAPEGCPWDREQTHESLRTPLLEEAYEVAAAIDAADLDALREELGDLLLQVVLHAQIAAEEGEFQMADVIRGIDAKLKHRHPHVWGNRPVSGTHEVLQRWEELKREEKGGERSVLDGVPGALPALQQADTYGRRVARVGFDWSGAAGVVEKLREEVAELQAACSPEQQEAELGDLLFTVVNWARWLGLDPESALRKANARFARRFRAMEALARERSLTLEGQPIEVLEALWQEAKRLLDEPSIEPRATGDP